MPTHCVMIDWASYRADIKFREMVMTIFSFSRLSVLLTFLWHLKQSSLWLNTVAYHCLLCFLPFLHSYFLYIYLSLSLHLQWDRALLLRPLSSKATSIFLGLTSTHPRLLLQLPPILPTWLPPSMQRTLLQGSQSNNAAFEAKAIITCTMHTLIWLSNPAYSLIYNRHGEVNGRKAVWCLAATMREISTILVSFAIVLT